MSAEEGPESRGSKILVGNPNICDPQFILELLARAIRMGQAISLPCMKNACRSGLDETDAHESSKITEALAANLCDSHQNFLR